MSEEKSVDKFKKAIATGDRAVLPEGAKTISIYIMGKKYEVPETLTILKAMEYAGFKFVGLWLPGWYLWCLQYRVSQTGGL